MSRILKINNSICDIDEQTSIGIDLQAYDIKDACKRKVNVSNSFSIPKTFKNFSIIGYANNVNVLDSTVYNKLSIEYWIDSFNIINNGFCYLAEISERINFIIAEKSDFWKNAKDKYFSDLDFITYLNLPSFSNKLNTTLQNIILTYTQSIEKLHLSFFYSNLFDVPVSGTVYESLTPRQVCIATGGINGGHFSVYAKDIFKYFETLFNVNFNINDTFAGNLFQDSFFNKIHIPIRDLKLSKSGGEFYFEKSNNFIPFNNIVFGKDLTCYDFIDSICKIFNAIIIQVSEFEFKFYRFDKLLDVGNFVDFSGKLDGNITYKPYIDGFAQNNYITWKTIFKGGDKYINSKKITCQNKNIEINKDIIQINGYIGSLVQSDYEFVLLLNTEDSIRNFEFLIDYTFASLSVQYNFESESYTTAQGAIANYYGLSNEYNLINTILQYPKYYEIKKWLSVADILNFDFYKLYWLKELNASFFVNKISGFNPDKSFEPVTIELIKVSERPAMQPIPEAWVDGEVNIFTDGEQNIFY